MRSSRLVGIVLHLQRHGTTPAAALAQRFEVSSRTILRDVEQLSAAGVPVYTRQGRDGGIGLVDGYRTTLTGIGGNEVDALAFIGVPSVAAQLGISAELEMARAKVLAALPAGSSGRAGRIADRFHVDPIDWYRRVDTPALLATVAQAVWAGTRLAMRHESWPGRTRRRVDPIGIVLKAGTWYLVADREGLRRVYRIDRIVSAAVTDEPIVTDDSEFRLADFWGRWRDEYEGRLRHATAVVRLGGAGRANLGRIGAHLASDAVELTRPGADGWSTVRMPIETIANAARDLMVLGAEFEVVEPAELRAAVRQLARDIARRHTR